MSTKLFPEDVLFGQQMLASAGLYKAKLDGIYGPKTDAAWSAFFKQTAQQQKKFGGKLDPRSEASIGTLLPYAQGMARTVVLLAKVNGIDARITSGTRSLAEQAELYARGRTAPGKIVTKAKPGSSLHNYACAIDVSIFVGGAYVNAAKPYNELAKIVLEDKAFTEEWGGNWKSITDRPHYQTVNGLTVAQIRKLWVAGTPFLSTL